jgi:outer membrane protein OmpA-like peptidoglycan-associated protein
MTKDAFARPAVVARSSRRVRRAVAPQLSLVPFGLAPLLGLTVVFLLALGLVAFGWVQDPAERAARQALTEIGATWATPKVSGQWVVLEGAPPSREAAAQAIDAVEKARAPTIFGPVAPVSRVTDRFVWNGSAAQAEPAPPSVSVCDASMSALLATSTIEFDTSSAAIRPANAQLIDSIVRIASACQGALRIEGHTDNAGSPQMNAELSRQRANAVREALIQRGIDPARISADGYGATRPVANNGDATGRARNRRIEVRVVPSPT